MFDHGLHIAEAAASAFTLNVLVKVKGETQTKEFSQGQPNA